MKRTRISIPDYSDVPLWWTAWFHERQREIRRRVLTWLGRADRPMLLAQVQQRMDRYSTNEVAYALTTLSRAGVIMAVEREIHAPGRPCSSTEPALFFSLAKTPEPEVAQ